MDKESKTNPFIEAIDWESLEAGLRLRQAGMFAVETVAKDTLVDEEYVPEEERFDADPTAEFFPVG